jgi:hypothetical protein
MLSREMTAQASGDLPGAGQNAAYRSSSQSFRKKRTSVPDFLKLIQILREMTSGLE